ncbi:hypothetical protein THRCLA_01455 [Thraustotheca clavata]|uniref:Uncharacterized protein n=1 Tax=Thraustotheca clavata TaxID=74557 RepID=A0A1W0A918_9STRA|nr:hypothetical protein THRCLA_01455 [Thraustotheca clavata]
MAKRFAFKCTGCGRCCTGKGGVARVNGVEIAAISDYLSMPEESFVKKFVRIVNGGPALRQTEDDSQCVFLDNKKCTIYPVRPTQCRTYPFWPQQLISKYDWQLAAKQCEGIKITATDEKDFVPDDVVLKEMVVHEVHRSGEEMTYDDIHELVSELDPSMLQEFKEDIDAKYTRKILFESDGVLVMDSFLDDLPPTRSLHFTNRLELVQSEVFLSKDGSIDFTKLALDVHKGLCIGLALTTKPDSLRIGLLGAGAGVLPAYLEKNVIGDVHIDAVDPSIAILQAGREYFNLKQSTRLALHTEFGEDFLAKQESSSTDWLIIDVEDGSTSESTLRAPPASFLTSDFLKQVERVLTPTGSVAINAIYSDKDSALKTIQEVMAPHFVEVWVLEMPKNSIVFGLRTPTTFPTLDLSNLSSELARTIEGVFTASHQFYKLQ